MERPGYSEITRLKLNFLLKNKASGQSTGTQSEARMPDNVRAMAEQAVSQTGSSAPVTVNKKQRYFKVPFNPRQVTEIISESIFNN